MSWRASTWAVGHSTGSAAAKAVLLVLAEAADDSGFTFLGHDEIAHRADLGKRTVIVQMAHLEGLGLIQRRRRYNPADGSRSSNGVFLSLSLSAADAPRRAIQSAPPALREGSKVQDTARLSADDDPPKCISCTLTGHEPVSNHVEALKPAPPKRRKPETAIPDGFPGEFEIEAARTSLREAGVNLDPSVQANAFRDHAIAHDRRVRDWPAAFRMWITKAIGWAPASARSSATTAAPTPVSEDDAWRARLKAYATSRFWNATDYGPRPGKPGCSAPHALLAEFGHVEGVAPIRNPAAQGAA